MNASGSSNPAQPDFAALVALAGQIARLLKDRGETVAVAESSTGGLVSAALLAIPGASVIMRGGSVIYTRQARSGLLGLEPEYLAQNGIRPSTEAYAGLLAERVAQRLEADWGLGESGAAGPSGNRYGDKPGHSCIAVTGVAGKAITLETGQEEREANMWRFAEAALRLLLDQLEAIPAP